MRGAGRTALLLALSALPTLALAACGGGDSSTTTAPQAAASTASQAAKPFVEPGADNSIPSFGAEAAPAQRSQAEAALRTYLAARAMGEWAKACSALTASVRKQVQAFAGGAKGKACPAAYKALSSSSPASARANPLNGPILSLRIKGRSGFALFYGPKGEDEKYVMPMASEGGGWKVTQLAPIAYPLGSQTQTSP